MIERSYRLIMHSILRCQVHSEQIKAELERNNIEDEVLWKLKGESDHALEIFRLRILRIQEEKRRRAELSKNLK